MSTSYLLTSESGTSAHYENCGDPLQSGEIDELKDVEILELAGAGEVCDGQKHIRSVAYWC